MKEPPQRLVTLQPWLRPPNTSTWQELLSMTAPGAAAAVGLNVPALAAKARAQRLDERNAATEAARQHDKLQRYLRDMAAPVRTDQPRLESRLWSACSSSRTQTRSSC